MPDFVSVAAGDALVRGAVYRTTLSENLKARLLPGSQLVAVFNNIAALGGVFPISEPPVESSAVAVVDVKVGATGPSWSVAELVNRVDSLSVGVDVTRVQRITVQQATPASRESVRVQAETARAEANPITRIFRTAKTITYVAVGGLLLVGGLVLYRLAKQSGVVK